MTYQQIIEQRSAEIQREAHQQACSARRSIGQILRRDRGYVVPVWVRLQLIAGGRT